MEYFTLDSSLRRDQVIEGFESFIWAERYFAWGDFQIVTRSTPESRLLLRRGRWIGKKDSDHFMKIETVQDAVEDDGARRLTITGRSFEKILEDRVTGPSWNILNSTPGNAARTIFDEICVQLTLNANDWIPFYEEGSFLPAGTIPEPSDPVETYVVEPDTVYNALRKICEPWALGFRLVKKGDLGEIYFDIYTGNDRTSGQTVSPPVIFARNMENLGKTTILVSDALIKTVAWVLAKNDSAFIYSDEYDPALAGEDRRVLYVDATDIDLEAGTLLDLLMEQRGKEELAKNREFHILDGEIPQYQPYVYGVDYNLGDLVEERGDDGVINHMLVTEQIFVSDSEGERTFPTLMLMKVLVPGAWSSLAPDVHWADIPIDTHWADL